MLGKQIVYGLVHIECCNWLLISVLHNTCVSCEGHLRYICSTQAFHLRNTCVVQVRKTHGVFIFSYSSPHVPGVPRYGCGLYTDYDHSFSRYPMKHPSCHPIGGTSKLRHTHGRSGIGGRSLIPVHSLHHSWYSELSLHAAPVYRKHEEPPNH